MAEQAKKGGKPAAAPDKGNKVSDSDLEKVSGGTGDPPRQSGNWDESRGDGNVRTARSG